MLRWSVRHEPHGSGVAAEDRLVTNRVQDSVRRSFNQAGQLDQSDAGLAPEQVDGVKDSRILRGAPWSAGRAGAPEAAACYFPCFVLCDALCVSVLWCAPLCSSLWVL